MEFQEANSSTEGYNSGNVTTDSWNESGNFFKLQREQKGVHRIEGLSGQGQLQVGRYQVGALIGGLCKPHIA